MARTSTKSTARAAAKVKSRPAPASSVSVSGAKPAPQSEESLPGKDEIDLLQQGVRAFMADPLQMRTRHFLERLAASPPQVLLMEGGSAAERLTAARYWALLLNCPERGSLAPLPCLDCPECIRMLTFLHRDCFFYDGLSASIKIDEVRALRSVLGEPPREARYRVVVFREAQALVEAAANALLKSFEDPRPGTSFVMLAPQRERLLPTLVSRSFTLTLPWPRPEAASDSQSLTSWEAALCAFLRTGQGFLDKSGAKGAVDAHLAHAIVNMCRRALVGLLAGGEPRGHKDLSALFARMPETRLRMLDETLAECQDSLILGVNPALVTEWLATRLFFLYPRS